MAMNPAEYVIHIFGGVRAVARAVGRSPSSVSRWRKPREEDGSDGHIPSAAQRVILKIAKMKNLDVTPNDLAFGRRLIPKTVKRLTVGLLLWLSAALRNEAVEVIVTL